MGAPLSGTTILSLEQFGAGPWATMQLADLGAEVVKIEDPTYGGDVGRYVPPYQAGEDSLFFETFNRRKRSVSLDLRTAAGREAFEGLVRGADAVFSNLRGDQPRRLRITYEDLAPINPRVVCCSLSGFGMTGPRAAEAGYDYVIQGLAGWMSLTGDPDDPPTKTGLSLVDFSAGYVAAIALVAGMWRARETGTGCDCDISLMETALAQLTYVGTWVASAGFVPRRLPESAHPSIVPFQILPTSDGWVTIACAKQKFWERLCEALDRRDLATDPRFEDFSGRFEHREELLQELRRVFRCRTSREWLDVLAAAGVPSGPVNDVAGALADPQVAAREALVEIEHPALGTVRQVQSPLRVGSERPPVRRAPRRGEDTESVLRQLGGFSDEDLDRLRSDGAFGAGSDGVPTMEA